MPTGKGREPARRRRQARADADGQGTRASETSFFSRRGFFPHHYSLVIISTFLARFMLISTFYVRFMLISAFYADQANYKNSAFNAYHQANAVLCLSARLMLISRTIWRV